MRGDLPRVHVLGIVSLNGGDAAILDAQVLVVRQRWPDARVVVHDRDPIAAARYAPHLDFAPFLADQVAHPHGARSYRGAVRVRRRVALARACLGRRLRWRRLLPAVLRDVDLAVYTGGTTLTENYSLSRKAAEIDLVRRAGIPYVFFPQSAGPFEQPASRDLLSPLFAGTKLLLLRDERSLRHVLGAGARAGTSRVVPDVVFALVRDDLAPSLVRVPGPERVAVSVREWRHYSTRSPEDGQQGCVSAFRRLVTALVRERGAAVTFVSTCQGRPEYTFDDAAFAREVVGGLDDDVVASVEVDGGLYDAVGLRDRLSGFDVMISMRLHAAILAVCGGTPTLTVAYEYKSTEVWHQLGQDEFTLDLETLDGDVLAARASALLDHREQVREEMLPLLASWREQVLALGDDVAAVLAAQAPPRRWGRKTARR